MRKLTWIACALPALCLLLAEAAVFSGTSSVLRGCAGRTWLIISVAVVLTSWVAAITPFFAKWFWASPHRAWYLVAFFLPPILVLFDAGGVRFTAVDIEGLQQLAAGMFMLRHDPGLGIFAMAYERYMDRQYALNCLPAFCLGPSLWAARVGNSMFYIGSYCFFLSALASFLRKRGVADLLLHAGCCGMMIALGQYALLNARKFEQTMMPVGCMLFFLGALLYLLAEPGPLRLLWVTWVSGFFTSCYTPALGGWVLALGILSYLVIREGRRILVAAVIYGTACLGVTCLVMQRIHPSVLPAEFAVGPDEPLTFADWFLRCMSGIRATIGSDFTLIQGPLALAILAAVCLAWRSRDRRYAAVCAWACAVAVLSVVLQGSGFFFPNRVIQRSLIVIPPLALGADLLFIRQLSAAPACMVGGARFLMKLAMAYMVLTGVFTVLIVRTFFGPTVMTDEDEAFALVDKLVNSPATPPKLFYMAPPMDIFLAPGLQYFAPDARVVRGRPPAGEKIPGVYVLSYLKKDRHYDEIIPSRMQRPFMKLEPE